MGWGFLMQSESFISCNIQLTLNKEKIAKNRFLRIIVKGNIYLYEYRKEGGKNWFFYKKDTGDIKWLPYEPKIYNYNGVRDEHGSIVEDYRFIGILKLLMSDQPTLNKKIEKTRYNEKYLKDIIYEYNTLSNPQYTYKIEKQDEIKKQKLKRKKYYEVETTFYLNQFTEGYLTIIINFNIKALILILPLGC